MLQHSASAQSGRDLGWLQGKVVDQQTAQPLSFVRIELFGAKDTMSTVTDFDGFFVVRHPKEPISLRTDHEGYLAYRKEVDLTKGMVDLDIRLERLSQTP
ncbi:MAG: carboxypeptidase-like regulatory domain-containing protein [Flavobacteriales bacterium]